MSSCRSFSSDPRHYLQQGIVVHAVCWPTARTGRSSPDEIFVPLTSQPKLLQVSRRLLGHDAFHVSIAHRTLYYTTLIKSIDLAPMLAYR